MGKPSSSDGDPLPLSAERQVDALCDRFEAEWRAGRRPAAEGLLGRIPRPLRAHLLRELLRVELEYRRGRGEVPAEEEYRRRFPEYPLVLDGVFCARPAASGAPAGAPSWGPGTIGPCRTAEEGPDSPLPSVPGYEILGELGRGGMGVVYKARQVRLRRVVALKMVLAGQLATPEEVRRFRAETLAVARLDHPHIVPVHFAGEHQGQYYLCMKFIDGTSLAGALRSFRRTPRAAARLLAKVARAVHHAHQSGVLHRDLKPGNILLDAQNEPYVTDFGLAKRVDESARLSQSGAILGTASYMPPEQAAGASRLTPAADVYSLGAILYEVLTGRPPFQAETLLETLYQVVERPPQRPRSLDSRVDRDLETICLKCMDKRPARRYGSAEALAEDLEAWAEGRPIQGRRVGRAERLWLWCRRKPLVAGLSATAAALLVSLVAAVAVGRWITDAAERRAGAADEKKAEEENRARKAEAERIQEEGRRRKAEGERVQEESRKEGLVYLEDMRQASRALEEHDSARVRQLLGKHRPAPGRADARGWEWYHLDALTRGHLLSLRAPAGGVDLQWSPDGKHLAAVRIGPAVTVWDMATGAERCRVGGGRDLAYEGCFNWSPDGSRFALATPDSVKVCDASTGKEAQAFRGLKGLSKVVWSPDGRLLAAAANTFLGQVHVWDVAAGRELAAFAGGGAALCWQPGGQRLYWADWGGKVQVWEGRPGGKQALTFALPLKRPAVWKNGPAVAAFNPEGKSLLFATGAGTIFLCDPATGTLTRTLQARCHYRGCVAWDAAGQRVTWVSGGVMKVWDVQSGRVVLSKDEGNSGVTYLARSPDGRSLAVRTEDGALVRRDLAAGREQALVGGAGKAAWSADGKRLAVHRVHNKEDMPGGGRVEVYDTAAPPAEVVRTLLPGAKEAATAPSGPTPAWGPDGKQLVALRGDGTAGVYRVSTGEATRTLGVAEPAVGGRRFAWAPDGKRLATGDSRGAVKIWDAATGTLLLTLPGLTTKILTLKWSPDGRRLAVSGPPYCTVWDVGTGKELFTTTDSVFGRLAWSPDGRRLALNASSHLRLVDGATGKEIAVVRYPPPRIVCSFVWSPDGRWLLIQEHQEVAVWDAGSGKEVFSVKAKTALEPGWGFWPWAWSADGKRLALVDRGLRLQVFEAATGKRTLDVRGPSESPLGWTADGKALLFHRVGSVCLVDAATGKEASTISGYTFYPPTHGVGQSPDGRWLALCPQLRVVDLTSGKEVLRNPKASVHRLQWSPDGRRLAWGGDGAVTVWDAAGKKDLWTQRTSGALTRLEWSSDGRWLACEGATISVRDGATGEEVVSAPKAARSAFAWAPGGRRLLVHDDVKALVFDVPARKQLVLAGTLNETVHAVDWHPKEGSVATGSRDGRVRVWDAATGKLTLTLHELAEAAKGHAETAPQGRPREEADRLRATAVAAVAWSPDGRRLAAAARAGDVLVWDARTGKVLARWRAATGKAQVLALAWGPDGKHVATGADDAGGVWEAATGKQVGTIRGPAWSIAWSRDGQRLAVAGGDATVKVFRADTGETALVLRGPANSTIAAVAWSPDGRRLATSTDAVPGQRVHVWDAATGQELLVLRPRLAKSFGPRLPRLPGQARTVPSVHLAWSRDGRWLAAQGLEGDMPVTLWAAPGYGE